MQLYFCDEMKQIIGKYIYWLIGLLLLTACDSPAKNSETTTNAAQRRTDSLQTLLQALKAKIKTGDLVLRSTDDLEGESLRNFNEQDLRFSHCGIALWQQDSLLIYHCYAGKENPSEKMLRETFEQFTVPTNKLGVAVYRYQLDSVALQLFTDTVIGFYRRGVVFDKQFNLKNDDHLYCAEMVAKALARSTNNQVQLPTTRKTNNGNNIYFREYKYKEKVFEYYALDNLFLNPFAQSVGEVVFTRY
jgi:hypothetical protein